MTSPGVLQCAHRDAGHGGSPLIVATCEMDLIFAYVIVLVFAAAIVAFAFGAIGPGIALLLISVALLFATRR